jgi:hypothetical protein
MQNVRFFFFFFFFFLSPNFSNFPHNLFSGMVDLPVATSILERACALFDEAPPVILAAIDNHVLCRVDLAWALLSASLAHSDSASAAETTAAETLEKAAAAIEQVAPRFTTARVCAVDFF